MRKVLSIVVVWWVFILAPGFCLGAIGAHDCGCAEAGCPDCLPDLGGTPHSHGCHDDPCPKHVCRMEQDDAPICLSPEALAAAAVCDCLPAVLAEPSEAQPSVEPDLVPRAPAWGERSSLSGLPLLI